MANSHLSASLAQVSLDPSAVGAAWNTQIFCDPLFCDPSLFIGVHISSAIWFLIPTVPLPHPKHKRSFCDQMGDEKKINPLTRKGGMQNRMVVSVPRNGVVMHVCCLCRLRKELFYGLQRLEKRAELCSYIFSLIFCYQRSYWVSFLFKL